jgi:hypothetical protein
MAKPVRWQTYEEVAAWLLNQFASEFGLDRVEGKQDVSGACFVTLVDPTSARSEDGDRHGGSPCLTPRPSES